jgi:uncharacterized OB-fold protein
MTPAYAVPIELRLRYAHGLGGLSPYFAGLERGVALATRCPTCNRTWFAPRLTCTCGSRVLEWVELSGYGKVVALTRSRVMLPGTTVVDDFAFALIRLDGADNLCFGRLDGALSQLAPGSRVRISRAAGQWAHPAQCAKYVLA